MIARKYYICLLSTKNYAMQVMYVLEKLGYKRFELIFTPYEIKKGCNYSIKFNNLEDLNIIINEVYKLNINIESVYSIERINGKKVIKKINYFI
ncbi:MAG TPA: putative Se/S carrier-like protein [Tissierellales bacterium]|nr:putative Se/S carrier-like protein [Tissierellales bacterium]